MTTLTGAEVLVEALAREGIRRVFSIPGGQLLPVYDAIREHPELELIVPRHEGASALMAAGYCLAAGVPGAVMSTVGAGVIYEAGGLLYAYRERLPVLSISPQVQSWRMKPIQESLQACDQDEIFRPLTKFRAIVYHFDRIPQLISRAVRIAAAPEPGPVHLDFPVDVLFEFHRVSQRRYQRLFRPGQRRFQGEVFADEASLASAARLIGAAARPLALVGRGIERAGAGEALAGLVAAGELPVITSTAAWASVGARYERRLGPASWWREETALAALAEADLVLFLEADEDTARLGQELRRRSPGMKSVQAAFQAASLGSVVPIETGLVGTPRAVMTDLAAQVKALGARAQRDDAWLGRLANHRGRMAERSLAALGRGPRLEGVLATLETINRLLGPGDTVICDGAMAAGAGMVKLVPPGLHGALMIPDDSIPGTGLPLALGIKAGRPQARVFLIAESGRFKRHSRELQSARRYGLGVTTVVFQEKEVKPAEEVDFARLAQSLGVPGRAVLDPGEEITEAVLGEALASPAGMLFDATAG